MASQRLDEPRPRRLRGVGFIAPGFDAAGGGMEGQARRLARALAARGVPVTYVTTAPQGAGRPVHEVLGRVQVFRVPVLTTVDWTTSLDLLELACLGLFTARRARLDAIYAVQHTFGALAARVGRALGVPVVVKLAGGGLHGDARAALASPRRACLLADLRRTARVVAVTEAIAVEARDLLGVAPERVTRIPNGVDLEAFTPLTPPAPVAPAERIVFLGRLRREKRVDVLLQAFAAVARERSAATLLLVGDGPERAALEAQAARLGLAERVRFLGHIAEPLAVLRGATALALPSDSEGLSNALLEGMACALPIVATRIGGTDELVRDEVEGLLVTPGDAAGLAASLSRLLSEPDLARRLGDAGRRRVEQSFDLEVVASRYVLLFEELLRERGVLGLEHGPRLARAVLGALARTGRDAALSTANIVRGRVRRALA